MPVVARLIALFATLLSGAAFASDETTINLTLQIESTRIAPSFHVGGSNSNYRIALRGQKDISESITSDGRRGMNFQRATILGAGQNVKFRVVNANTIQRVEEIGGSTIFTIIVTVRGNSCTATGNFRKKPGARDFTAYSTQLGTLATFSRLQVVRADCQIN